jgi:hypothetical protein
VPEDVHLESGGRAWTAGDLERRARVAIRRHLRLLAG